MSDCDRLHFNPSDHVERKELQDAIRDMSNERRVAIEKADRLERAIEHLGLDPKTIYSPPTNLTGAALEAYQDGCEVIEDREQGGGRAILCGCEDKRHATNPHPYWSGRFIA